jgi:hypothetical protein
LVAEFQLLQIFRKGKEQATCHGVRGKSLPFSE